MTDRNDAMGSVLVAGVGPGLGAAIATRFAQGGEAIALGARSSDTITALAKDLNQAGGKALALPYDVCDEAAVGVAIAEVEQRLGPIATLVYNAGNYAYGDIDALSAEQFAAAWQVGPYGAFLHAKTLLPLMAKRGQGTIIFTGATSSLRSPTRGPAFGSAKFGLRGLAMALSRSWSPRGVHVAHVILDGVIRTPKAMSAGAEDDAMLLPADIAETYYQLALQPRSAWTFELDLRPCGDDYLDN